jgi:hypothetical protein
MAVIAVCAALVVLGVVMVVRWGAEPPSAAAEIAGRAPRSPRAVAVGLLRYLGVAFGAGMAAGVLAAGAGGRLVMRLLAATSPEAEGKITDAGETVGRITVDGTLGFIIFAGLPAGFLAGALYALVGPVLPTGRAAGLVLGVLLLVLAGPRLEPLLADNPDFAIVGPDWLSVLAFTILGLFQGMLVVALGARMSRHRSDGNIGDRPPAVTVGRLTIGVVLLVALPGFLTAVGDILRSG